jgi:hypothetical protein
LKLFSELALDLGRQNPHLLPALAFELLSAIHMPAGLNKLETNILENFKCLTMLHCGSR